MDGIANPLVTIPLAPIPGHGALPATAAGGDFALLLSALLGIAASAADASAADASAANAVPSEATQPIAIPAARALRTDAMPVLMEQIAIQEFPALPMQVQQAATEPTSAAQNAPGTSDIEQVPAEIITPPPPSPVAMVPVPLPSTIPAPEVSMIAAHVPAMPSVAVVAPMLPLPPAVGAPMKTNAVTTPAPSGAAAIATPDTIIAADSVAQPMTQVAARAQRGALSLSQQTAPDAALAAKIPAPFPHAIPSIPQFTVPAVAVPVAAPIFGRAAASVARNLAAMDAAPAPANQAMPLPDPASAARREAAPAIVAAEMPGHDASLPAVSSTAAREPASEPRGTPILPERIADPAVTPPAPSAPVTTPGVADAPPPSRTAPPPPIRQVAELAFAAAADGADGGTLSIALDPGELGRVEIRVERHGEAMRVRVLAERPETLLLLQRDARELDRMLGQSAGGNETRALSFGLSSQSGGQGFGGHDQRRRAGAPRADIVFAPDRPAPRALLGLIDIAI